MDGLCQAKALCQVFSGDELLWFKEAILRHLHLIRWIALIVWLPKKLLTGDNLWNWGKF